MASNLTNRRRRMMKKYQSPTRSGFPDDDKENSSPDNPQLISNSFLSSNKSNSGSLVLRVSDTDNCSIEDVSTLSNNLESLENKAKLIDKKNTEVIVISDSSENEEIFSRKPESSRRATNIFKNIRTSIHISSATDDSNDEDFIPRCRDVKKTIGQNVGARRRSSGYFKNLNNLKQRQRCSILYTSDDTASTASSNKSKNSSNKSKVSALSSISHISPTPRSVDSETEKGRISISKPVLKNLDRLKENPKTSRTGASPSFCSSKYQKVFPRKSNNRVTKLTRTDALKILKVVKSKRLNYFSASSSDKSRVSDSADSEEETRKKVELKKSNIIEETDSDNSKGTKGNAIQISKAVKTKQKNIIEETDSEVESSIVNKSPEILRNVKKPEATRLLETPKIVQEQGYNDLSARKRKEIAKWLMSNSPDPKNDSSFSHISESNRNSISSGNSSLERLETNYETPNNRGMFLRRTDRNTNIEDSDPKTPTNSASNVLNGLTLLDTNKRVNIRTPRSKTPLTFSTDSKKTASTGEKRQTKIDEYLRKTKTVSGKYVTEMTRRTNKPKLPSIVTKPLNPEDVRIEDCVDILDQLYGDTWRAKADVILSEPRKKQVTKRDRGVQTERKLLPKPKGRLNLETESDEDLEFRNFAQNVRPTLNSTRKVDAKSQTKTLTRKTKPKESKRKEIDSFINDGSSSDVSVPSSYYTALTNPQLNIVKKKATNTPESTTTLRAMVICDPETDEEPINEASNFKNKKQNRRKLFYSDDENESNTSEFDPEDIVPPKTLPKKTVVKISQRPSKPSNKFRQSLETRKTPSFLTSLSSTIPISGIHPDARVFREDFKKTKEILCQRLYAIYNENVFDDKLPKEFLIDWSTRMRGTAGFCYNKKSIKSLGRITRCSRIVLSTKVVDKPDRLRDTLLHEMCHAASWIINEVSDGHGPIWKGWAKKAMKVFPELPPVSVCHNYKIHTKFTYKCTSCGYSIGRHSKSLDVQVKRCGYCHGKFELFINRTTKSGTVQMKTPSRSKDPSAFALYVKENYQSVKQNRRSMKHGDVMKVLGQQFSAIKIAKKQDDIIEEE